VAEWYAGSKLRVYIDPQDEQKFFGKEHGLLLMNHTYEIDWLTAWMITDKLGNLGGTKAYAKKMLRYVPVLGWVWWMAEFIFLDRNFEKDKVVIKTQLKEVFSYPDPVWLLLNAEGTRFTPAKHELSVKWLYSSSFWAISLSRAARSATMRSRSFFNESSSGGTELILSIIVEFNSSKSSLTR